MSDYALFPVSAPLKVEKFREAKPIVEAVEVTEENMDKVADWCGGVVTRHRKSGASVLEVPTHRGIMVAAPGFYIFKNEFGHYIPYTKETFLSRYEKAK